MYPVSESYKNAISAHVRYGQKVSGKVVLNDGTTTIELSNSNIVSGSLVYTAQIGDGFSVGGASSSQLELGLITDMSNPYNLYGARVTLSYGIVTDSANDSWEWVPLGTFYVKEVSRQTGYVKITAYDSFVKMDIWSDNIITEGSISAILTSCLNECNITGDLSNLSTFPNYNRQIKISESDSIETLRDCVMWICQLLGCFSRINREGIFELVHLYSDPVKTITPGERSGSTSVEDGYSQVTQITMSVDSNDYTSGTSEPTMELEENPLMSGWDSDDIQSALDAILTEVTKAVFMPMSCSLFGDPSLMPGDYVTLSDTATLLDTPNSLITSMTWTFRGEHSLTSDGVDIDTSYSQSNKATSALKKLAEAAKTLATVSNESAELIKQTLGGNVLIRQTAGTNNEILIMDSPDPEKAVKIWRWNMGGLGYSDNCTGADNTDRVYKTAITMDGAVSADFIKTGLLTSQNGASWINLNTGEFSFHSGGSSKIYLEDGTTIDTAINTASSTANTALTAANSSVATVTTQYYDSTSATEMTGGSWSDTSPTWQEGHYIWSRTKTVSADGKTTEYSEAVCITGNTGKQGGTGSAMHWNLLSNTNTSSLVANISTSAGETSREFADDETDANVKVLKLTSNLSSFTWWYLYVRQPSNIKKLIESGPDTLTVSMDIRINTDLPNTIFPFSIRDGNGTNAAYDGPAMAYAFVKDTWKHCVWHMTKVAGQSYSAQVLYSVVPKELAQNGMIFELKNLKLEEGNTATEWCTTQAETIGAAGTTYYTWIKYADSPTSGMSDNPSGKTYIGIAYNKTTATESTSYSDYSWSLIKGDKGDTGAQGATGATGAAGVDYSQGKMLYTDPTFDTGVNKCVVYNNTGNGNVTITRSAKSSDNPFDKATYELVIANKGTASPVCGGFFWANRSRANARFIYRIIAKIPTGYTLVWNADPYGSGGSVTSRTSMAGTGKFQEYVFEAKCGATGTFSTIGFFYLDGTVGTADNPVTWYVAYATCFDMTSSSDVQTAQSTADQANTDVQALSTTVVQNYVTSAQLDDRITSEVGALTTTIEGNKEMIEERVSDVEQSSGEWSATVSKHTESITKLQDDVLDVSTTVSKTMKLTEEGLSISAGGSTNTVLITNDSINFKVGEYTAAYISDKQLWIKDAVIENSMTLGKFAFIPRDSGNLSLVRKDG